MFFIVFFVRIAPIFNVKVKLCLLVCNHVLSNNMFDKGNVTADRGI